MQARLVAAMQSTTRRQGMIALVSVMSILAICAGRYAVLAILAVRYPYGLDYGEGIVWHQMHMVMAGTAYGPISGFPSIAFPYPPLYYVVSHFTAQITGWDELATGRLISILSAVATAWFAARVALRITASPLNRKSSAILATLAALVTLGTQPMFDFSILMRVDLLFVALSFAGFYFGIRALDRPGYIFVAAILFVAAIYTKQIAISAPIAVFGVLLVVRPRTALIGMTATLALGFAVLVLVTLSTRGGFLMHVVYYTITKFDGSRVWDIFIIFATHLVYVVIAFWSIKDRWNRVWVSENIGTWKYFRNHLLNNSRDSGFCMAVIYLFVSNILLLTVLKTGSTVNYFLEWGCLVGLIAAVHLSNLVVAIVDPDLRRAPTRFQVAILWAVAIQAIALFCLVGRDFREQVAEREDAAQLISMISRAPLPVSSDDMVALLRAGKPVLWEPFIFKELAEKGAWDERPLLQKINAREFAFFVTEGVAGDGGVYNERYTPAVTRAIDAAYPVQSGLGIHVLHFPTQAAMDRAEGKEKSDISSYSGDKWEF